jgi:hypothetical protein
MHKGSIKGHSYTVSSHKRIKLNRMSAKGYGSEQINLAQDSVERGDFSEDGNESAGFVKSEELREQLR